MGGVCFLFCLFVVDDFCFVLLFFVCFLLLFFVVVFCFFVVVVVFCFLFVFWGVFLLLLFFCCFFFVFCCCCFLLLFFFMLVSGQCPSSVIRRPASVVRRSSCGVRRQQFALKAYSSYTNGPKLGRCIGVTCRLKIAKTFRSEIKHGCHGGHLENLFFPSPPEPKGQLT